MADGSLGLFEPDALLPAQFYSAFRTGSAARGEKRLMLAVLRDAVECYQKYAFAADGPGRQLFADARGWIASEDRRWYFSFENICDILQIDADCLRDGVARWRRQQRGADSDASVRPPRLFVEDLVREGSWVSHHSGTPRTGRPRL